MAAAAELPSRRATLTNRELQEVVARDGIGLSDGSWNLQLAHSKKRQKAQMGSNAPLFLQISCSLRAADAATLLESLCDSQLPLVQLVQECAQKLGQSAIRADRIKGRYLIAFEEI